MTEAQPNKDSVAGRYERYRPVVEYLSQQICFDLDSVKQAVQPETGMFVSRIVNELVQQGWLVQEAADPLLRWNNGKGEFSVKRWLDDKLFGNQIKIQPQEDRPRERLLAMGVEQLRTSELIAILVRSGRPGESAIMAGEKVAKAFNGRLEQLATAGRGELKSISVAVEKTAFCQIMAGIELGRRIAALAATKVLTKITGSEDAVVFCQKHFSRLIQDAKQEEFHIVTLDTKNQIIDTHMITTGTLDSSLVHPREVFRAAIKDAAASILLVHNHPSGDPTPSRADHAVTDRLTESGKLLGIEVLDHIVLGRERSLSIRATV